VPATVFHPKGRHLVQSPGFTAHATSEAIDALGEVPVAPLLTAIGQGASVDDVLAAASRDPLLFRLSRGQVVQALKALVAAGFLEPDRS
jgi:hypothetical protein